MSVQVNPIPCTVYDAMVSSLFIRRLRNQEGMRRLNGSDEGDLFGKLSRGLSRFTDLHNQLQNEVAFFML